MCNEIGNEISKVYSERGLSTANHFENAFYGEIKDWTSDYNDSLNNPGRVCKRVEDGKDYYGVLRGSAQVGVPGIIVEHGFHTVAEFRKEAMKEDLLEELARADAVGIARYLKDC